MENKNYNHRTIDLVLSLLNNNPLILSTPWEEGGVSFGDHSREGAVFFGDASSSEPWVITEMGDSITNFNFVHFIHIVAIPCQCTAQNEVDFLIKVARQPCLFPLLHLIPAHHHYQRAPPYCKHDKEQSPFGHLTHQGSSLPP